jgi:hypothetical protein
MATVGSPAHAKIRLALRRWSPPERPCKTGGCSPILGRGVEVPLQRLHERPRAQVAHGPRQDVNRAWTRRPSTFRGLPLAGHGRAPCIPPSLRRGTTSTPSQGVAMGVGVRRGRIETAPGRHAARTMNGTSIKKNGARAESYSACAPCPRRGRGLGRDDESSQFHVGGRRSGAHVAQGGLGAWATA